MDRPARRTRYFTTGLACVVYGFLLVPSIIVMLISFGLIAGPGQGGGTNPTLRLYAEFLSSPAWMQSVWHSVFIAFSATILSLGIGIPATYGLERFAFPGKNLIRGMLMTPLAVPTIIISLGIYFYFSTLGLINSFAGLVLAHTVYVTPYVIMTLTAGIRKIDPRLEFAAQLMGAGRQRVFWCVMLPQIRPSIIASGLFALLMSFDEVVIAWFISGVQTETLPVRMYSSIQWEISPLIAVASTLLSAVSFLACLVASRVRPVEGGDSF
ncbi:ABC transporter permease [Komagataeibacter xylinus]|uniref:ABC transporter permease n=1 Tax=Komagataeibacter xylinus TaxID=28448 RepID=UPI0013EE5FD0|nr:ABC transporter permease [Komagataeibacter xylinus]